MKPAAIDSASAPAPLDRTVLVAQGRRLEYFTIAWNGFEAAVALISGMLAGSVALVGFGLDSVIETLSAAILLWRLRAENDPLRREHSERVAHRLVGICFLALAIYVGAESLRALWMKANPAAQHSWHPDRAGRGRGDAAAGPCQASRGRANG